MKRSHSVRIRIVSLFLFAALTFTIFGHFFPARVSASSIQQSSVPTAISGLFSDYSMTSLDKKYDTMEKLDAFRNSLGGRYSDYFDRAERIIRGELRFEDSREFSTEEGALNKIEQNGNLTSYSQNTLRWGYGASGYQVTGMYAMEGEVITVYVDAQSYASLPTLTIARSHGHVNAWTETFSLRPGINTITVSFGYSTYGENGGAIYLTTTTDDKSNKVKLYIEGGSFYPVYRKGDDEKVFMEMLTEYEERRLAGKEGINFAELLPDHAILTVNSSSLYDAYIKRGVSPKENIEKWSDYLTAAFEFIGIPTSPESVYGSRFDERNNKVRVNYRYMSRYYSSGAYCGGGHIGIYEDKLPFLVDFNNMENTDIYGVAHELGHNLDNNYFAYAETTNNTLATFSYLRVFKKPVTYYQPFARTFDTLSSDYTLDYTAYDVGKILYTSDNNYDHNYLIWWYLESVFPGYYARLNDIYRFENTTSLPTVEKMVYYSSLATGVDLSEYFERWGYYTTRTELFKRDSASSYFTSLMKSAKAAGKISDEYSHFWYVDANQYDFSINNSSVPEKDRAYQGAAPKILSAVANGDYHVLSFSEPTDKNFYGYEILSRTGSDDFKIAGFASSTAFTDTHDYGDVQPEYKIRAVNRFYKASNDSETVTAVSEDAKQDGACRVNDKFYDDLASAVEDAGASDTIYLLRDVSESILDITKPVTIEVDPSVHHDITIYNSGKMYIFSTPVPNGPLTLKGRSDARIILDGVGKTYTYPAINAGNGKITASYVTFRNYESQIGGGAIELIYAPLQLENCIFENCGSKYGAAIGAGNKTIELKNCTFINNYSASTTSYRGAIKLNENGECSIENCDFSGNEKADLFLAGKLTFVGEIPELTLDFNDFDGEKSIALDGVSDKSRIPVTLVKDEYGIRADGDELKIARAVHTLTFISTGKRAEYVHNGMTFVFGQETSDDLFGENKYIALYTDKKTGTVYHPGDIIQLTGDMEFDVTLKEKIAYTLNFDSDVRTVYVKDEEAIYLPRFDGEGRKIVRWITAEDSYLAGAAFDSCQTTALYAVYDDCLYYRYIDGGEIVGFGWAKYGEKISVKPGGSVYFDFWQTENERVYAGSSYTVKYDVTFTAVYGEGENILLGDVNGDGSVNVLDLLTLKKYIAGQITAEEIIIPNADINSDGIINAVDLMLIKNMISG